MDGPDPDALARCVEDATYPVTWEVSNWSTQLGSDIKHALHRRAARAYACRYHAEHGRLPEGRHHLSFTVVPRGSQDHGDLEHPFIGCSLSERDRHLEIDVTYPALSPTP
jgi:hypothetical protein